MAKDLDGQPAQLPCAATMRNKKAAHDNAQSRIFPRLRIPPSPLQPPAQGGEAPQKLGKPPFVWRQPFWTLCQILGPPWD